MCSASCLPPDSPGHGGWKGQGPVVGRATVPAVGAGGEGHTVYCLLSLLRLVQLSRGPGHPLPGEAPPPTQPGMESGSRANEEAEARGGQLTCWGLWLGNPQLWSPGPRFFLTLGELGVVLAQEVTVSCLSEQVWWQPSRSPRHIPCMCVPRGRTSPSPAGSWAPWPKGTM